MEEMIESEEMTLVKPEFYKNVGRKNTSLVVHDRRLDLAKRMSVGTRYHDLVRVYTELGLSPSQLKDDMRIVRQEWRELIFTKSFQDTLAEFIETVQESIKIASESNQPSSMQSGVILLNKLLDIYHTKQNKIDEKDVTIQYQVITKE